MKNRNPKEGLWGLVLMTVIVVVLVILGEWHG